MLGEAAFLQTDVVPLIVAVGNGFTVTVKVVPVLPQPFALVTLMVPVYVPGCVFAGTEMLIGLAFKVAFVTGAKLFAGDAFHVILYFVGPFVAALYGNVVV